MSTPEKHSVMIAGHRTSISLEPEFWETLREIAAQKGESTASLLAIIDETRTGQNLSSAARIYVLNWFKAQLVN
jgi:predicted DNA-binding ribbon-helix-helix protein